MRPSPSQYRNSRNSHPSFQWAPIHHNDSPPGFPSRIHPDPNRNRTTFRITLRPSSSFSEESDGDTSVSSEDQVADQGNDYKVDYDISENEIESIKFRDPNEPSSSPTPIPKAKETKVPRINPELDGYPLGMIEDDKGDKVLESEEDAIESARKERMIRGREERARRNEDRSIFELDQRKKLDES